MPEPGGAANMLVPEPAGHPGDDVVLVDDAPRVRDEFVELVGKDAVADERRAVVAHADAPRVGQLLAAAVPRLQGYLARAV